jgi:TatD DNase family protein
VNLVDVGVNLTNKAFGSDLAAVLERAADAGVTKQVVTGTSLRESHRARELATAHPGVLWSTAGVHPHDAKSCDAETIPALRELAATPEVVAIGECGLDFNRDFSPRPDQREWFTRQVDLAIELDMPLFLHERDAGEDLLAVLRPRRDAIRAAVVHCFTGDEQTLDAYLELDLHIGITGWICDERRGQHLLDLVPRIPLERLMLETDSPYLVPRTLPTKPKRGRNEPAFLPYVLTSVSEALGSDEATVAAATTRTAERFFGL